MKQPTIFALSSGPGVGGVAVVRVSGTLAGEALKALTGSARMPQPRKAVLRALTDPVAGTRIDTALVLYFPAPASFTGEDVVEFHVHGGRAVVDGLLAALGARQHLQLAEPGEFSRRAFEAGKLDLTEIEGLGDLIQSQTAAQREQALRQLDGSLSALYEDWRARLVRHLAHLEADIDFPDEDLPEGVATAVLPEIVSVRDEMAQHLEDGARGQKLREGFRIVILGEPNAGKSSLLNYLASADVAIVTEEPGTTRDVLDVQLDLGGYPVRILDTAGIRGGDVGRVEAEGIRRARALAADADLKLILVPDEVWPGVPESLTDLMDGGLVLVTKVDTGKLRDGSVPPERELAGGVFPVSVRTGFGLPAFLAALQSRVEEALAIREAPALTRARHREALVDAVAALDRFEGHAGRDAVLAAEEVRLASRALGRITGRVGVEDILDQVFADFCIGK